MRKKALLAIGAAAIMTLGVSAGTVALFSAQSGPSQAILTAGTVNLKSWRDQGDTIPGPMFYTTAAEGQTPGGVPGLYPTGPWAPGDTVMRVLMIRNNGELDAWLTGIDADLVSGSTHLAAELNYRVTTDVAGANAVASGNLAALIAGTATFASPIALDAIGPVPTRAPKPFYFWVSLPLDADNSYQSETLRVDFTVNASQKRNNP